MAVHVAFVLVGLRRLLPADWQSFAQMAGWLLPLALSAIALLVFQRRYRQMPVPARGA